jgi:hypothetical protein
MGGCGSGSRNRWASKTDEFHRLDLAGFKREWFENWRVGTLTWSRGDHVTGRIGYHLRPDHMRLVYLSGPEGNRQSVDERFELAFTDQKLGGQRLWIVCPSCQRRCRVLYGGRYFRCRKCWRATYESQYERYRVPGLSSAQRVREKLGGEAGMAYCFPRKPKGMHWRTYRRLQEADWAAEAGLGRVLSGRW